MGQNTSGALDSDSGSPALTLQRGSYNKMYVIRP